MSDTLKGEQALRVLDAIAQALRVGELQEVRIRRAFGTGSLFTAEGRWSDYGCSHDGESPLDALSQLSQVLILSSEPWGEPGALDAESDVDAFDRATGGGYG